MSQIDLTSDRVYTVEYVHHPREYNAPAIGDLVVHVCAHAGAYRIRLVADIIYREKGIPDLIVFVDSTMSERAMWTVLKKSLPSSYLS